MGDACHKGSKRFPCVSQLRRGGDHVGSREAIAHSVPLSSAAQGPVMPMRLKEDAPSKGRPNSGPNLRKVQGTKGAIQVGKSPNPPPARAVQAKGRVRRGRTRGYTQR